MRDAVLYSAIGSFILGVVYRSFFAVNIPFLFFVTFIIVALGAVIFRGDKKKLILCTIIPLVFLSGIARFSFQESVITDHKLEEVLGQSVTLSAFVSEEVDRRENAALATVNLSSFDGSLIEARALVITDRLTPLRYGTSISLTGTIEHPTPFETDTGRLFDYQSYLRKDNVGYVLLFPTIEIVGEGAGSRVKHTLLSLKERFITSIQENIPHPHAPLLGGILLGTKHAIGEELTQDFRDTGIIHIVVLSGYNVTIVADTLMKWFSLLPTALSTTFGASSIVLFAIMTGASATTVRASLMALLVIFARVIGRKYLASRALFIAGTLMVLHNPYIVVFDPSFQLSFLATVGLIYLSPFVERYVRFFPERFSLRSVAVATLATQLCVLPLLIYLSGEVSLVALPVNLLILVTIPAVMLAGFLVGVVGSVSLLIALPLSAISYVLLSYDLVIVSWFAELPFASVRVPSISLWLVVLVYIVGALLLLRLSRKEPMQ